MRFSLTTLLLVVTAAAVLLAQAPFVELAPWEETITTTHDAQTGMYTQVRQFTPARYIPTKRFLIVLIGEAILAVGWASMAFGRRTTAV